MAHTPIGTDIACGLRCRPCWARNEQPQVIKAGDTVWMPPDEEHWHGASANSSMTHIAIQEAQNGRVAEWLEKVSDEDYSLNTDE